jgi:hypothetical protein
MRLFKLAPNGSYFATNPTRCTNWVSSTYARSWETNASANADVDPAIAGNDSFASSSTTTPDCTTLPPFNPGASISAAPATTGTPSSITLSLTRPNAPATIVQPHIKQVDITFPEGVEINPALFNDTGDSLCTDAQFNKANPDTPATCPAATAIATITTTLPLMSQPTSGTMYLGTPLDNAGNRYRAFIDLPGKMGIKFEGRVFVDPATGQISATVGDSSVDRSLPQVPYSIIALTTKSGPRAAFINPLTCGDHFGSVKFTPWSGQAPATKTIDLVTDNGASPCFTDATRPFAPTFSMTPTTALADSHDSYDFHIDRPDGDQNIRDVAIDLPVGLIAAPAHAAECSESQLAAAGCPASSKVGTADVASGSGSDDFTLSGEIFNIVPQAGQVAKMAAVVHAIVGPYDLGNVILPLALTVRDDLGVSAASAAIPERIGGVAVRVHSIDVHLVGQAANGSFMRAPSRCGTHTVTARITSTKPETINRNASLTTTGCAALAFSPTFSMSAQADPTDKKGDLPSWKMHLGVPAGDSALSNFKLLFPLGVQSNLGALNGLCSDVNYRAGTCPAASLLGTVRINTPLLSDPLDGKVLLVQAVKPGAVLPRIGLSIDAPFKLRIAGDTNFVNTSQIFSEFSDLPDLPISSLDIDLFGGARGILQFVDAPTCGTLNFTLAGQGGQTTAGAQPFGGAVCADYQSARCASGEFGVRTSGMAKKAGKKARFTASLQMPRRCPAVTAVQIKLPKGSKINKKAARKLVIARIAGKKMKLGSVTVAKTTLLIKSLSGEPIDIRLGSSKGVVKLPACKKGKKCWKRNMTFSALARLSNGADWRSSVALKRSSRLLR